MRVIGAVRTGMIVVCLVGVWLTGDLLAAEAGARGVTGKVLGKFVRIRAGQFDQGAPKAEEGQEELEGQRRVTLTRSFLMQTTEVTQGQYQALLGKNPSSFSGCGDDCPVEQVSWFEAVAYVNALSRKAGLPICYEGESLRFVGLPCLGYRLPTEAEWEYAARAGTQGPRYGILDEIAWHQKNSNGKTHPVRRKKPNAWGLYDLLGNVQEWCHDYYAQLPKEALSDPTGWGQGTTRAVRGGGWNQGADQIRAAERYSPRVPGERDPAIGFRPVRTLPAPGR